MRTVRCSGCREGGVCPGSICPRGCLLRGGVCPGGVCPRGVVFPVRCLPKGGCLPSGVSAKGVGVCPGGCLPGGVSAWRGVCPSACWDTHLPVCPGDVCPNACWDTHPLWTEWQTLVKILPCRNYVVDGNQNFAILDTLPMIQISVGKSECLLKSDNWGKQFPRILLNVYY